MSEESAGTKSESGFGFDLLGGGVHTARTMMLEELQQLLTAVRDPHATPSEYVHAITDKNCLNKSSAKSRSLTARHLITLYTLDPSVTLFRSLIYLWRRDTAAQPLLALQCALARDSLLRATAPLVLGHDVGSVISRLEMEGFVEAHNPGRFSPATLKSVAQNINSTWTKSGHLVGKAVKTRTRAVPTAGATVYALLLGYLEGARGASLFETDFARTMDCPLEHAIELAGEASRHGWMTFRHVAGVYDVSFPALLTALDMEWVYGQN